MVYGSKKLTNSLPQEIDMKDTVSSGSQGDSVCKECSCTHINQSTGDPFDKSVLFFFFFW